MAEGRLRRRARMGLPMALATSMASRIWEEVTMPWLRRLAATPAAWTRPPICAATMLMSAAGKMRFTQSGTCSSHQENRPFFISHSTPIIRGTVRQSIRKTSASTRRHVWRRDVRHSGEACSAAATAPAFPESGTAAGLFLRWRNSTAAMNRKPKPICHPK